MPSAEHPEPPPFIRTLEKGGPSQILSLIHRTEVIDIDADGYRVEEAKELIPARSKPRGKLRVLIPIFTGELHRLQTRVNFAMRRRRLRRSVPAHVTIKYLWSLELAMTDPSTHVRRRGERASAFDA